MIWEMTYFNFKDENAEDVIFEVVADTPGEAIEMSELIIGEETDNPEDYQFKGLVLSTSEKESV